MRHRTDSPWRRCSRAVRRLSAATAVAGGVLLTASAAAAVPPSTPGAPPLPERDARTSQRVGAAPATERARGALESALGTDATVASASDSGALHLLQRGDGLLTGPSDKAPATIALDYVRDHQSVFGLDAADRSALDLTQDTTSPDGITHVTWQQTVDGVPTYDTALKAHLTSDGRLVSFSGDPVPELTLDTTQPTLDGAAAQAAAAGYVQGTTDGAQTPRLVAFPQGSGARLAWDVTAAGVSPYVYDVVVDATTGALLRRRSLTEFANAQVWQRFPGATSTVDLAQTVNGSAWLNDTAGNTRLFGNNAHVYSDLNGNDVDDAGENVPTSGGGNWIYPQTGFAASGGSTCGSTNGCSWNAHTAGSYATNRAQDATQVFYYVNLFHDHLAAAPIGFNEASGNFQVNNLGRGGAGGDPLLAEPDDGASAASPSYNNANMSTPADGASPRMQMYLFTQPFYDINGGDIADIVYHEYTHGLSGRLVSDLDGLEGGAMGEGWSDWYALDFLNAQGLAPDTSAPGELEMGEPYLDGNTHLSRTEPIDCPVGAATPACPGTPSAGSGGYTYGDVGRIVHAGLYEVHSDGEMWAQTLWDLRGAVGASVAETLITGGMRLSPRSPAFLDERDAILQEDAAAYGGVHTAALWAVFAARGMGYGASLGTEDFTLPPAFDRARATGVDDAAPLGNGNGVLEPGEAARLTLSARNLGAPVAAPAATVSSTNDSLALVSQGATQFPAPWTGDAATQTPVTVTVPAAVPCGTSLPLQLRVGSATATPTVVLGALGAPVTTTSADVPKVITDANVYGEPTLTTSALTLPAGTAAPAGLRVSLSITHSYDGDLIVVLSHAGRTATLIDSRGDSGANFTSTVFSDAAAQPISAGTAPFTGTYRPESPLSVFDGTSAAGAWTLRMYDQAHVDEGTLTGWSLGVPARTCSGTSQTVHDPPTGDATPPGASVNPQDATTPPVAPPPLTPGISFVGSPKTVRLTAQRALAFTFKARAGVRGTVAFASAKKVRVGRTLRTVALGTATWTASAKGVVTVRLKVSRSNAALVKRLKTVKAVAAVTSGTTRLTTTLTVAPPRPRR